MNEHDPHNRQKNGKVKHEINQNEITKSGKKTMVISKESNSKELARVK